MRSLKSGSFCWHASAIVSLLPAICLLSATKTASAQITGDVDPVIMEEISYAEKLNSWGMPDLAEKVVSRITAPEAKMLIQVIKLQAFIAKGEFQKVIDIIGKKPDQASETVWAMKLTLADGYYAWGKYGEAQGLYDSFFKAFPGTPSKELRKFYLEAAYKYSQMLLLMGKDEAAVDQYTRAIKAIPKNELDMRHIRRQMMGEKTELMIKIAEKVTDKAKQKEFFDEINEVTTELLWYQDLWFGKAIVYKAHILMLQKKLEEAEKLIKEYTTQLKQIDESLKESARIEGEDLTKLSPMAQCRYLLGKMMYDEAKAILDADGDKDMAIKLLVGSKKKVRDSNSRSGFRFKQINGAFHHFVNVFIRYPNTTWAPECGKRVNEIKELAARDLGIVIDFEISPEQRKAVEEAQFQQARSLYNQKQFDKAVKSYLNVLELFPEGEISVAALGELAASYLEEQANINDDGEMHVTLVLRYIADRFHSNEKLMSLAGDQLLKLATMYDERKMPQRRDEIYDLFFSSFTRHPRAAAMLFMFGRQRMEDNDIQGAKDYFGNIVKNHRNTPLYTDALGKLAECYEKTKETANVIKILNVHIKELEKKPRPGYQLANGLFKYAEALKTLSVDYKKKARVNPAKAAAYRKTSRQCLLKAISKYKELNKLLSDPDKRTQFFKTKDEEAGVNTISEGAMFYEAVCYSMIETSDKAKEKKYNMAAIKKLNDLVNAAPKSAFAPYALSQMATLYTVIGSPDDAAKAIRKLQKDYPESKEAENAQFLLADNLLKLGRRQEAVREFKKMFKGEGGEFPPPKILTAGNELLKAGEYDIANDAFDQVIAQSKDRIHLEPATLGKGKALIGLKKFKEAAKIFTEMLETFQRSGYTVEANQNLSKAYRNLAEQESDSGRRRELFDKSVDAIKEARKYAGKNLGLRSELDIEVAGILTAKYKAEKNFGDLAKAADYLGQAVSTYQTMVMFAKVNEPEILPSLEKAFAEGGELMLIKLTDEQDLKNKKEDLKNVIADCDRYTRIFGTTGERANDIRRIKNRARSMQAVMEQTAASATVTTATNPEPAQKETAEPEKKP